MAVALRPDAKEKDDEDAPLEKDDEDVPFMDLHMVYVPSDVPERNQEYCMTLLYNTNNPSVRSVNVYTAQKELDERCGLDSGKVRLKHLPLEQLTHATMLGNASSLAGPTNLQVVLNSDIVLGDWSVLGGCLGNLHRSKKIFHLSRQEPQECFPLSLAEAEARAEARAEAPSKQIADPSASLLSRSRKQTSFSAPDKNTYMDICASWLNYVSQDVIAFNQPLERGSGPGQVDLDQVDFAPNHLGAENLLSCVLSRAGFVLSNPCFLLPSYHNHCSDVRKYSQKRVDDILPNYTDDDPNNCKLVRRSSSLGDECEGFEVS